MNGTQFYVLDFSQVQLLNQLSQVWRAEKSSPSAYETLRFEVTGMHNDHTLSWWAVPSDDESLAALEQMVAAVRTANPVKKVKKVEPAEVAAQGVELVAAIRAAGSRTGR